MRRVLGLVLLFAMPCYGQEDWLGEETLTRSVSLFAGTGTDNLNSYGISLGIPAFAYSQIHGTWRQQSSDVFGEDSQQNARYGSIAWRSDPFKTLSYGIDLSTADREDQLESKTLFASMFWNFTPEWQLGFGLAAVQGDVDLQYLQIDFEGVQQQSINYSVDSQKLYLELAYFARAWGIRLSGNYGFYDEPEVSPIQAELLDEQVSDLELRLLSNVYQWLVEGFESRGFSPEESANRAAILFLVGKDRLLEKTSVWVNRYQRLGYWLTQSAFNNAKSQQSHISKYDVSLQLLFDFLGLSWDLSAIRFESYYLESTHSQASLNTRYDFSDSVNINLNYSTSLDDDFEVYQVELGFNW